MAKCFTIKGVGQIEKTGRNTWSIRCSLGWDPVARKYKRSPRRTVHGSKAEAIDALTEYRSELTRGYMIVKGATTVEQYATAFHELREGADCFTSPLAYKREALEIGNIIRFFGPISLDELDPITIRSSYAKIRKSGVISDDALHKMHVKFKQVMAQAAEDRLVMYNPLASITMKRPKGKDKRSLSLVDAIRLNKLLVESAVTAEKCAVMLALHTGMRRGEILGLLWSRVDFERKVLYVACQWAADKKLRDPKSEKSKRWIGLDDDMLDYLKRWKEIQKGVMELAHSISIEKNGYADPETAPLQTSQTPVVTNKYGGLYDPNIFSRWFRNFCVENGFGTFGEHEKVRDEKTGKLKMVKRGYQGLGFHELRHTHATLLVNNGLDLVSTMTRLGHTEIETTAGYAHSVPESEPAAAARIQQLLRGETKGFLEEIEALAS